MSTIRSKYDLRWEIEDFLIASFTPHFGRLKPEFTSNPSWQRLKNVGSELWLDTGSISNARQSWTNEFTALTTNNSLLNKEIQTGRYDSLIFEAARLLDKYPQLTEQQRMLEINFILNAWHGLRLVEKFDAFVSVEEHTNLANNVDKTVEYARRFHNVCPERFIIKIPFTPAGLLAARKVSAQGITVNFTLGFSARQNFIIARIAQPRFVNVFLGRLNSFIQTNKLGDGSYVGEKATLASQKIIKKLRSAGQTHARQIAASFRAAEQIRHLAGVDVMTIPPQAARGFLAPGLGKERITNRTESRYKPGLNKNTNADAIGLNTLWDIEDRLVDCLDALKKEKPDKFTPSDLITFFRDYNCSDVMVPWSKSQIAVSAAEGKIPKLVNWKSLLARKKIGLDSLMSLAGLNSFAADQKAMDRRIQQILAKTHNATIG